MANPIRYREYSPQSIVAATRIAGWWAGGGQVGRSVQARLFAQVARYQVVRRTTPKLVNPSALTYPLSMLGFMVFLVPLSVVVGLVVGFFAGRFLLVNRNIGEALVANTLSRLTIPHVLINNVTLPVVNGTTQIDHLLVTEHGLFVIETKHYRGWIFGRPNDDYWTQTTYRKKSRFRNPLSQNFGHIKTVEALFKLPESAFIGVVVFTGEAEFKSELGPQVIHLADLLEFVGHDRQKVLDERQMAYVVGRIEMKRLRRSLETDEYHLNYVRRKIGTAG